MAGTSPHSSTLRVRVRVRFNTKARSRQHLNFRDKEDPYFVPSLLIYGSEVCKLDPPPNPPDPFSPRSHPLPLVNHLNHGQPCKLTKILLSKSTFSRETRSSLYCTIVRAYTRVSISLTLRHRCSRQGPLRRYITFSVATRDPASKSFEFEKRFPPRG